MWPIARLGSRAGHKLRERNRSAIGVHHEPLVVVPDGHAYRRLRELTGAEPEARAARAGDVRGGLEMLLADQMPSRIQARDEEGQKGAVHVSNPDDQVVAGPHGEPGTVVEVGGAPVDLEPPLGRDAPAAFQRYGGDVERVDREARGREEQCVAAGAARDVEGSTAGDGGRAASAWLISRPAPRQERRPGREQRGGMRTALIRAVAIALIPLVALRAAQRRITILPKNASLSMASNAARASASSKTLSTTGLILCLAMNSFIASKSAREPT